MRETPAPAREQPVFVPKGIVPTAEQQAIQLARRRAILIEANAGAAKTTTLALRLAQALLRGAEPERILALTYTEAAVLALKQALARIGVAAGVVRRLRIQTFDDFCAERLTVIEDVAVPRQTTPEQLKPHVLAAIERMQANPDERHADELAVDGSGEAMVEGLLASFARLKGTMQLALEAQDRTLTPELADELGHGYFSLRAFWAYEHIRRGGHPDHHAFRAPNDATYDLAHQLLDEDAFVDLPHPLAMGLNLVLVDEMHDTNRAMFTVLKGVLQHNSAGFVGVGDRDQVIHAVAGAEAAFMGETFLREIGPALRMPLSTSYRFGPSLAQSVSQLTHKPCQATATRQTVVQLVRCESEKEVHWHIAKVIRERQGLAPKSTASEIAVLLRQPHQSVDLENHLLDHGVDYRCSGFQPYLMRPEVLFVRGLIAYAQQGFAGIEQASTREQVLRALLLFSGAVLEDEKASLAEVVAQPQLAPFFVENQVLRLASPVARKLMLDAIAVLQADATDMLLGHFTAALQPAKLAARVMVLTPDIEQVAANIAGLVRSAGTFDNVASFFRAMNAREVRQHGMTGKDRVVLSSIEAAKGLEFDHVIMPGLNKGEFALGGPSADNRNLLYVGMTRARHHLTLLCDPARPSRYLFDAGLM
ncbi:ATP-dependent helicase [Aquabacterium sp.]|uniref:UvrD-helicase domain-containing protein n=1 Tax=Aquabacterium sp. TaxID=1872578 RepID=UPI0025C2F816|nr:ATP-dependent helicase [Aquabacterium sp.]